jgi:hypothetical protein
MGKAKLGVLLAGAYAFGLALLVAVAMALPCETLPRVRTALCKMPEFGHRAARLVRVAVHAGSLGVKHLPTLLEPQGASSRRHSVRFCTREPAGGCGSSLAPLAPTIVRVVVRTDG